MVHRAAAGTYSECEKLRTVSPKQKGNVQTVICGFAQPFVTVLENSVNVLKGFPFQTLQKNTSRRQSPKRKRTNHKKYELWLIA